MFMREKKKQRLLQLLTKKQREIIEIFSEDAQIDILNRMNDGYSIVACNSSEITLERNSTRFTIDATSTAQSV